MKRAMLITPGLIIILAVILLGGLLIAGCKSETESSTAPKSYVSHLDWSKDAIIYEVNVRQFTPEGTFEAFRKHLPRIKELGVDIIWLMPIHPIGEKNRKGSLGSYYSVQDYTGVNPEFGNMDDLKALVDEAHKLGMYVILDWVANHTAWDNAWIEEHPEWYAKDENGAMIAPFDWTDVAKLNFENEEMRAAMIEALKYWIVEADVDGYRCDVAGEVPLEFWDRARKELDQVKPVFMLAEAEEVDHHFHAFDMSYAWELHHIMNSIARGEKNANDLAAYFVKNDQRFPEDAYRMCFITNHDENSWNGTEYERMGNAVNTFAMLSYTLPGMPMIYSGQESAFDRRLLFFEKDSIDWADYSQAGFYRELGQLRKENPALWSGLAGAKMKRAKTTDNESIFAFHRKKDDNVVMVIANLSPAAKEFSFKYKGKEKELIEWKSDKVFKISPKDTLVLKPWEYIVLLGKSE